ncbi:uncharacterized protein [Primulina huaijiensis]|uniref:uncharacterized protein n=1 Tax=Primulina huaijiensis TaxID=1492673 RepID=UPI003CC76FDF
MLYVYTEYRSSSGALLCHDDLEEDLAHNVWSLKSIGSLVGLVGSFVGWWNSLVTNNLLMWTQPLEHFLKCNVDAAIVFMSGHAGYGCIIRNRLGSVLGAIHGILPGIRNPSVAEVLGIREVLSWIKDLALSHVLIEFDALSIVNGLNSSIPNSSSVGLILEDCKI